MVPNGWKQTTLNQVSKRVAVGLATSVTDSYRDSGIPIIRNLNIKKGHFDASKMLYLDEKFSAEHPNKRVRAGDVITVHTGSNVGLTCVVPEEYDLAQTFTTLIVTPKENVLDSWFLNYVLNSEYGEYQALRLVVGGGKGNLNTSDFKRYPILLPTYPEQRKIAQILFTWDRGIATTEKLINASKQQKKALMQQLLTGKKRLVDPETGKAFEGEWEEVKLKQIGKCITGLTYSPNDVVDEGTLVLRSSNIQGGKLSFLDNVYVSSHIKEESKTRVGDILICVRNGSRNLIGKSAYITDKASGQAHGAFMTVFRGKYAEFVFQLFQTVQFHRQVNKNLGATINSINTSDLHKFKFNFPKDKNEIEKIATVLSGADKEIELLETKLAHLKQEKKALMQQLLTGKRRVSLSS